MEEQPEERVLTKRKLIELALYNFDRAKDGTGQNNHDLMCDSLENLKSHLKSDLLKQDEGEFIKEVERRVRWFRTLESNKSSYIATQDGMILHPLLDVKVNNVLTECREKLQSYAEELGYI